VEDFMKPMLRIEELEERIAPTVVAAGGTLTFTDANGDHITVAYDGLNGSSVNVLGPLGADIVDGNNISTITFNLASAQSLLRVTSDGAGANDIVITGGISAPGQDVGSIVLGFDGNGAAAGTVVLGTGVTISVGGALAVFAENGNLDCDLGGQSIVAGDDIGAVFLNNLYLDHLTGEANIAAGGAGGGGNISFIVANDVFAHTGAVVDDQWMDLSTPVTVPDDAGHGDQGSITMYLSGGAAQGEFLPVAVTGGGFVIAGVSVDTANTTLVAIGDHAGGDISVVTLAPGAGGVQVFGAPDVDVLLVSSTGSVGAVVNRTFGGDIGSVIVDGNLTYLQTSSSGVVGSIFTGFDNSIPMLTSLDTLGAPVSVLGDITSITTGGIYGNVIEAASIGSVQVGPGGIGHATIDTTGGIGPITTGGIYQSDIITDGQIGAVSIGAAGMSDSTLTGFSGISSVVSKGAILFSHISATSLGDPVTGGAIGKVTAPLLSHSTIDALNGITSVTVKGEMIGSTITTRFDDGHGGFVGGGIGAVSVGSILNASLVEANTFISSLKVGSGGITGGSDVIAHGDLTTARVAGDLSASGITADGAMGSVTISGDVTQTASVFGGTMSSLSIGGSLADSTVTSLADAGSITVKGSMMHATLDLGTTGKVSIGRSVVSSDILSVGSIDKLSIGGNLVDGLVSVATDLGAVTVKGAVGQTTINAGFDDTGLPTAGSITSVSAGTLAGSTIAASRDIGKVTVKGIISDSTIAATAADSFGLGDNITGGGSLGPVNAGGLVNSALEAYVNAGKVTLGATGMDFGSTITTYTGNFAGLTTKGLVSGLITIQGNLTGNILTAGLNAVGSDGVFFFTDANGQPTDGELIVVGSIPGNVKIS
jgi:hypothetical protein